MLQSYNPLCGPSLDSLWDVYVLLVLGSPQVDTAFQTCLIRAEQRGRIISHDVLATFLIMQPKMLLAFRAARVCYSLTVYLESTRAPGAFLQICLSSGRPLYCTGAWGYSSPDAGLSISFYWTSWDSCWLLTQLFKVHLTAIATGCCVSHSS